MSNQTNTASNERGTTRRTGLDIDALMTGPETWFSTMAECQKEVGRFITDRLEKDAESLRQTFSCRNWTAALELQGRWVDETLRDYSAQMSKLTGLYAKGAASTVREERRRV